MSRNEDRLGGSKNINSPSTAATTGASSGSSSPSPLEFVRPTSLVSLPSGGKFYPEGHPLHGVGEIEVRHMTTAEEDILLDDSLSIGRTEESSPNSTATS